MKTMLINAFNVPDTYDGDNGDDGDEGEDHGDGNGEEDRNTAALTLARHRWSVRPTSCDGTGDEGNGDEGI